MAKLTSKQKLANNSSPRVINHCTNLGELYPRLSFPHLFIPKDLKTALENNLMTTNNDTQKTRSYVQFLQNLGQIERIEQEHYLFLFKILLYVEDFARCREMQRHNLVNHEITQSPNDITVFNIFAPTLNIDDPFIKMDDEVDIKEVIKGNTSRGISYRARIIQIFNKNIKVVVPKKFAKKYVKDKKYDIFFIYSNWCMKCYHYMLHLINRYNLVSLMYPTIRKSKTQLNEDLCWFNKLVEQNSEQKEAIVNILNMTAYPAPYVLFGPPGTGKTATLVELICQIWKKGTSKGVLVCASSNSAIDEIATRLLKYVRPKDMHRMYSRSKKWCDVSSTILPCANFVEDISIFLPKDILLLKRIVLVTLSTCTRLLKAKFRENHFSYIIIDEASQAIEPETLIPLMIACTKDEGNKGSLLAQVVIAGDPCQLGPFIQSKIAKQLLGDTVEILFTGKSMLERFMDFPLYKRGEDKKYDPRYVTKLIQNYRSHECILHVPNKEFYEGDLIASGGAITRAAIGWSKLPNPKFPLIFHASNGKEQREENSFSVYNVEEISITMKYLKLLLGTKLGTLKVQQEHIGIITPFKLQQTKIKKKLEMRGWKDIEVGTVELFQGREKEIVILSTVRSRLFVHDGIQHVGFLSNEKRFNVAVTRAKSLLVIIGNPTVLHTDKYWRLLMQYCIHNKACIGTASEFEQLSAKQELYDKLRKGYVPNLHKGIDRSCLVRDNLKKEAKSVLHK